MNFLGVGLNKKMISVCVMDSNARVRARKTLYSNWPRRWPWPIPTGCM
jgi:hypothetical protein